jgi:hypothetical protein
VLHLSAARAYREGRKAAATAIIEIADAAEREWLSRGNRPAQIGPPFTQVDRGPVLTYSRRLAFLF